MAKKKKRNLSPMRVPIAYLEKVKRDNQECDKIAQTILQELMDLAEKKKKIASAMDELRSELHRVRMEHLKGVDTYLQTQRTVHAMKEKIRENYKRSRKKSEENKRKKQLKKEEEI